MNNVDIKAQLKVITDNNELLIKALIYLNNKSISLEELENYYDIFFIKENIESQNTNVGKLKSLSFNSVKTKPTLYDIKVTAQKVEKLLSTHHKEFIKYILYINLDINDDNELNEIYSYYMS